MKFTGKVALVTGASSGIGRASALALAKEGADVAINYLTLPESAENLAAEVHSLGRRALLCQVDVSDQAAVEKMVQHVVAELGRLDLLVISAVYSDRELFWKADMAGFRKTIDVSMWGAFTPCEPRPTISSNRGKAAASWLSAPGMRGTPFGRAWRTTWQRRPRTRWPALPRWNWPLIASV